MPSSSSFSTLPLEVQKALGVLYRDYTEKLKPVLAMVESYTQEFPGPILNEIRALNDHVSRCFNTERSEADCLQEIKKGHGHLVRAILDCYKCLLIAYDGDVKDFFAHYKDVCIAVVDDGKFLPELTRLYDEAKALAVKAKIKESNSYPEKEQAYDDYESAIIAFAKVKRHIANHSDGLANARQYAKDQTRSNHKFSIISALWGTLFGVLASLLMNWILG